MEMLRQASKVAPALMTVAAVVMSVNACFTIRNFVLASEYAEMTSDLVAERDARVEAGEELLLTWTADDERRESHERTERRRRYAFGTWAIAGFTWMGAAYQWLRYRRERKTAFHEF